MRPIHTRASIILIIPMLVLLSGCKDDVNSLDLEKDPLRGQIGGEEWEFETGNAEYSPFNNDVAGLILGKPINDPCAVRLTAEPHLSVRFPLRRGNYTIPSINGEIYVVFNTKNGAQRLTASAGFIEIVAISDLELIGYINADFDDKNDVQGAFLLKICN